MGKIIVRDLTVVHGKPKINEMVIPDSALVQVVVVHGDGTETPLFFGEEIERAMTNCDCPNNRCVKKHKSRTPKNLRS